MQWYFMGKYILVNMEINIPNLSNHFTLIGKEKYTTFSFGFWILSFSSNRQKKNNLLLSQSKMAGKDF